MVDHVSPSKRSQIMARVSSKDTKPELIVRRALHSLGYRYRLHRKDLPGSPDIVFLSRKVAIFVHGCYWHGHECRWGRLPKSNTSYWRQKIEANTDRDKRKAEELSKLGWRVLVVWQCELRDLDRAMSKIIGELEMG